MPIPVSEVVLGGMYSGHSDPCSREILALRPTLVLYRRETDGYYTRERVMSRRGFARWATRRIDIPKEDNVNSEQRHA